MKIVPGIAVALALASLAFPAEQPAKAPAKDSRPPWTTSRITGAPEPPPPFKIVRAFPKLSFKNPLLLTAAPGSNRFFLCEQAGKIWSFPIDDNATKADLALDVATLRSWDRTRVKGTGDLYGLAFHPRFAENRYCYICYILESKMGKPLADGSRISRFKVTDARSTVPGKSPDPPRIDPNSEKVIFTWRAGGHNGCDLHFGPDGFLYISTGDGANPNPPDALDVGQDLGSPLSKILRIDVDREENGKPYAVPPDNPFVKTPGARPETWAYGFRNPWRMSFDRHTGDLWVGDVGWEQWEMIYRVRKGGNYGWSVMEGPQQVRPESKRGPTPILPPALALPHTESASITGGYVYRGKRFPELAGLYICGDWVTRKVWATKFDGDRIVSHKELAQGAERVVAFGEDHDRELYIVHHDERGSIHKLVPNEAVKDYRGNFPRKLSETGLFSSAKDHLAAEGVMPFSINAERWLDHAVAERLVGLPGTTGVKIYDKPLPWPDYSGHVHFPRDGVLAKTISMEMERGNPRSRKRLETQILHFDGSAWKAYSYAWNDEQTDASLVPAAGMDASLTVIDAMAPGGKRQQRWHFPSRTECLTCHNPWAGYVLAFTTAQLGTGDQLKAFHDAGVVSFFKRGDDGKPAQQLTAPPGEPKLTPPHDAAANIGDRARAYLHVNCAHCHQPGAGGTADLDLRFHTPLARTRTSDVKPVQGTFEIPTARIVTPGDPYHSVLYYRMAKSGSGHMPHLGSEIIDERGLRLIHDWIRQLPQRGDETALVELRALDEEAILAREKAAWPAERERLSLEIAGKNGRKFAADADRKEADSILKQRAAARAQKRSAQRSTVINQLLSSTSSALRLATILGEQGEQGGQGERGLPNSIRADVLTAAMAQPNSQIRDLFERFVPDSQKTKRLGSTVRPEQILRLSGDAERGRQLFFKSAGLQCVNCHRVGGTGSTLGPDLSDVGKKYSRAQILDSILEPSKFIDPKYVSYLVETTEGKFVTGLLASRTEQEIVLNTVGDKQVRIEAKRIVSAVPQQKSLMPDLLLRDVTVEQAADLLEFLARQTGK